ncbi:DUF1102 domain-containing protein [Halorubellus sp. JP-L1]|uniref:DUF1102 domain-containing protein n=1 Tax=Halorubellus sp. JP-L1 TaxID=2715753 RepID=UPI00140A4FB5|nr:DUF1102 domain-containing protein [Halorubellus sp. JP-L1]NHN41805.1 DUF1102 domain-containing protein [Halorubellus sp. JP-L1]
MERRKFMIGVGSLAAGSAAAMGTGAFNFANVERGMSVDVTDDGSAFLSLQDTSPYADGSGNQLGLTFDDDAGVGGTGVNENSDYSFTGVFGIRNRGSQSVGVWINDNDSSDAVEFYGAGSSNNTDFSTSIEGSGNAYAIDPGETVYVNVVILLRNNDYSDLPDTINVVADASAGN